MIKTLSALGKDVQVEVRNENEHIQKYWMNGNFYETQRNGLLNHIGANEKKRGKFFDIGASIGNHSCYFAIVMEASELHSFEPCPDSHDHLVHNLGLNLSQNWIVHNVALGEGDGKCSMESVSEKNIGMKQVRESDDGKINIRAIDDMDVFIGYDVIKIDVEHYNEELLKGAAKTFTAGKGNIYIEAESEDERILVDFYMMKYGYKRVQGIVFNHTPTYKYIKS